MGDLGADTAVVGEDGAYRGEVSPDWEIWGPMGGYLAGIGLRSAGLECGRTRPASISVHFLGGIGSGPVDVAVETVRTTRVATSLSVTISQGERTGLRALVWAVDEFEALEHHTERRPDEQPPPKEVPSFEQRSASLPDHDPHPFWQNLDFRPLRWIEDWDAGPHEPNTDGWYRFQPTATFDDPWVDAVRLLILVDLDGWPAAHRAHPLDAPWFAPTIELAARFLGDASEESWLRAIAEAPVAVHGLVGHHGEVWSPTGRLLAAGGSTLLSRPAERRPSSD